MILGNLDHPNRIPNPCVHFKRFLIIIYVFIWFFFVCFINSSTISLNNCRVVSKSMIHFWFALMDERATGHYGRKAFFHQCKYFKYAFNNIFDESKCAHQMFPHNSVVQIFELCHKQCGRFQEHQKFTENKEKKIKKK